MVLMSAGKAARHAASLTNQTTIYAPIGGLAPTKNVSALTYRGYVVGGAALKNRIPGSPEAGLIFMQQNGLIQRNPQCSGGVGRKALFMCYR